MEASYTLLAGIDSHPGIFALWLETCEAITQMMSRACLRVCHTAVRLSSDSSVQALTHEKRLASGGLGTSVAVGRPQEAIGIFALSDHQPDIGLFWLLRSMHAQLKLQKGSSAVRLRLRTTFWALVARSRLLAWDVSIPHSESFFSELMSFPEKEIIDSVVAFHFLEAGGPSEMIPWLMKLHLSRYALLLLFVYIVDPFFYLFRFGNPPALFSVTDHSHFHGRVRVIFVSSHNFATNSTTARMVCPLIAAIQRSPQFDVSAVGLTDGDEPHSSCLPVTSWHVFSDLSDIDTAQSINAMRPHVLVDTVGFTMKARVEVFARRPARVQVHWHGMPYTSGSSLLFDTYVGDRISTSVELRSSWAESLLLLPLPYLMNSHKIVHPHIDRGAAATSNTRQKLFRGTSAAEPSRSLLAASFNVPFKIQRELFDCWCSVVARTEKLHIWIAGCVSHKSNVSIHNDANTSRHFPKSVSRLRTMISDRNISSHRVWHFNPLVARHTVTPISCKVSVLDLLPRDSELQSKASADIVLDTWEFGGHTTSVDSLWAGVPVLTFAGPSLMSRVSSSLLIHLG
jgi:hypothetical protein